MSETVTELDVLPLGLGVLLLIASTTDLLWTTLWSDGGAGPLSSRLMGMMWRGLHSIGDQHSRLLSAAGPVILLSTLIMWFGLIWAGWTLVFAGGETAILDTREQGPISWVERSYFVAYTVFTMGNGDFTPTDGIWQVATSLATASGMLFVTLGVSYVLSVLGAVVEKRSFASTVTGIGERGEAFVCEGWNGEDLHELDLPLDTLSSQVSRLAKQHKAYPILHYYHSEEGEDASTVAVAVFDEALTILRLGIPEADRPNAPLVATARSSTENYLKTVESMSIHPASEAPPPPDLDRLREAGVPTVSDDEFADSLDDLVMRRRRLLGLVNWDGWEWPPANED